MEQALCSLAVPILAIAEVGDAAPFIHPSLRKEAAGLHRAISLAYPLPPQAFQRMEQGPDHLYLSHYLKANRALDRAAQALAQAIRRLGARALPIPASKVVDRERMAGHLSHREVARRAGLGWIGRSRLLVSPLFGARLRLSTILTDLDLPAREQKENTCEDGRACGNCRACAEACPARAIGSTPQDFNLGACLRMLRAFAPEMGGHLICGLCVKACWPQAWGPSP